MSVTRLNEHGRWVPAEPLPEPFGVLWGRLWHARRRDGQRKWVALLTSWLDARAISRDANSQPQPPPIESLLSEEDLAVLALDNDPQKEPT